jgi:PEP-CTERM motif
LSTAITLFKENSNMTLKQFIQAAPIAGALLLTTMNASAATIHWSTDGAGTGFNNTSTLFLNSSGGAAATLRFNPNPMGITATPSNINYGNFVMTCDTCAGKNEFGGAGGADFAAFTFNLFVTDFTDNATGRFVGTAAAGKVWRDSTTIDIYWSLMETLSGDFGNTVFTTLPMNHIIYPTAGTIGVDRGSTTINGTLDAGVDIPEPSTLGLIGLGLIGLGAFRKKLVRS